MVEYNWAVLFLSRLYWHSFCVHFCLMRTAMRQSPGYLNNSSSFTPDARMRGRKA